MIYSKSFTFTFFQFQVNFVRQLILLCVHLFFLSTAIFLRHPKGDQPLVKTIFCHIAEVCVLAGCIISIFALLAKEIYLQGYNSYLQNLVRSICSNNISIVGLFFFSSEKLSGKIALSVFMSSYYTRCTVSCTLFNN